MPRRRNLWADQFMRAFVLGRMYERRRPITTERVRELFGVSPATAKRDLAALRRAGAQLPRKLAAIPPIAAPVVTAGLAVELVDEAQA